MTLLKIWIIMVFIGTGTGNEARTENETGTGTGTGTITNGSQTQEIKNRSEAGDRVLGGTYAPPHGFPFMVYLRRHNHTSNNIYHLCGGSLITSRHVITAAMCVQESYKKEISYDVILGVDDGLDPNEKNTIKQIARITRHPDYIPEWRLNNIAILELEGKADLSDPNVGLIPLPTKDEDRIGETCTVLGWGKNNMPPTPVQQNKLIQADVTLLAPSNCRYYFIGGKYDPPLEDMMNFLNDASLCAELSPQTACSVNNWNETSIVFCLSCDISSVKSQNGPYYYYYYSGVTQNTNCS